MEEEIKEEKVKKEKKEKTVVEKKDAIDLESEKLKERIKKLNSLNKFGILPDFKLSKKEIKILTVICNNNKQIDFLTLCRIIDIKPSKLSSLLENLRRNKLIEINGDNISIYELGIALSSKTKKQEKRNKKFKQFINVLTDQEFEDFCEICKSLKSDIKMEVIKEIKVD